MTAGVRIALANLRLPTSPDESVALACDAVIESGASGAAIVCFPECFVPGYRSAGRAMPAPDPAFLDHAWNTVAAAAARAGVAVILGTERMVRERLMASALVLDRDGGIAGFQDKVQVDPSEEGTYFPGTDRTVFRVGPMTFGIVICHEGWRYPETVRWSVRHGAQVVFHPHFHAADENSFRPTVFGDPANSFHEKALLCRAAENTCWFATVNYAGKGSPTTSAVIDPDGNVVAYQPYGREGLLITDLDLDRATGLLARRYRPAE